MSEKIIGTRKTSTALADWIAAEREVSAAQRPDDPGATTAELAAMWDRSEKTTLLRIKRMVLAGRARQSGSRATVRTDGRRGWTPVYVLIKK